MMPMVITMMDKHTTVYDTEVVMVMMPTIDPSTRLHK